MALTQSANVAGLSGEVFGLHFSPDGSLLAAGCGDGSVRVFSESGGLAHTLIAAGSGSGGGMAITSVRFRPHGGGRTRNVLLSASAGGVLQHWHVTSGKLLHTIADPAGTALFSVDFSADGSRFAAAGQDGGLRIFDEDGRKLLVIAGGRVCYGKDEAEEQSIFFGSTKAAAAPAVGGPATSSEASVAPSLSDLTSRLAGDGHSNRVFAVKFHPLHPDLILTGGWDDTVRVWDLRSDSSTASASFGPSLEVQQRHLLFGAHICGEALDVRGEHEVLTGSWRAEDALQLWDMRGGLLRTIAWNRTHQPAQGITGSVGSHSTRGPTQSPCLLYAAQFSKSDGGRRLAAGGSGANELKVFESGPSEGRNRSESVERKGDDRDESGGEEKKLDPSHPSTELRRGEGGFDEDDLEHSIARAASDVASSSSSASTPFSNGTQEHTSFSAMSSIRTVGTLSGLPRGVFSLAFSPVAPVLAVGGGDGCLRILRVNNT